MWVWVCGPYAGDGADKDTRASNLHALNLAALEVFNRGHIPVVGINMALPMILAAGADDASPEIRRPLSMALIERCDAALRVGGASNGADAEIDVFLRARKPVYFAACDLTAGTPVGGSHA